MHIWWVRGKNHDLPEGSNDAGRFRTVSASVPAFALVGVCSLRVSHAPTNVDEAKARLNWELAGPPLQKPSAIGAQASFLNE
jgi:hypothetical protein